MPTAPECARDLTGACIEHATNYDPVNQTIRYAIIILIFVSIAAIALTWLSRPPSTKGD